MFSGGIERDQWHEGVNVRNTFDENGVKFIRSMSFLLKLFTQS